MEPFLVEADEPPPLLHPEMANFYRRQVHELDELLQHGPEAARLKAADMLRALISATVLTPNDDGLEIDVQGDLAGILAIASNTKSPRPDGQGLSQLKVVAGTRFHLNLRSKLASAGGAAMPIRALFSGLFAASA